MIEKPICPTCLRVLPYSPKDYVICQNCGDVTWLGAISPIAIEDIQEELIKKTMIPKKYFGVSAERSADSEIYGDGPGGQF